MTPVAFAPSITCSRGSPCSPALIYTNAQPEISAARIAESVSTSWLFILNTSFMP